MVRENHEAGAWLPVRRICRGMVEEVTAVAKTVMESIRTAQPVYSVIPEAEHSAAVAVQVRNKLHALSEQRGLSASELEAATDLAAERAAGGIPIDALIAAYQAGDSVIWGMVVERSTPVTIPLLPRIGTLMFEATSQTTTAMAPAHSRVARAIGGGRMVLAHQFLECLEDPTQGSAAAVIAARLQLDSAAEFVGLVWLPDPATTELAAHSAVPVLPADSANIVSRVVTGGCLEMIVQAEGLHAVLDRGLAEGSLAGRWGIGLRRQGLPGAGESLRDARLAFGCTSSRHPVRTFEQDWQEAVLLAERTRFGGLLAPAVEAARVHPHLAETVLAFAAGDMSIAATAPAVHLHANSVTYRLDRWSRLTGLETRSFIGLSHSVTACRLAELDG